MGHRPNSGQERRVLKAMRALMAAIVGSVALLAAPSGARAGEPSPVWKDGWTINVPGAEQLGVRRHAEPVLFAEHAVDALRPRLRQEPLRVRRLFDRPHARLRPASYGLGNMQATLGVRMAEPLASNGFTPSFDPRRYLGVGPRVGLEGNQPLQSSWVVEWQVGAALLSTAIARSTPAAASPIRSLPNFASSGSVVNVDGLLGLSYWFDTASKLTLGYRADYFKGSSAFEHDGTAADNANRVDHGPMVRFSIQK